MKTITKPSAKSLINGAALAVAGAALVVLAACGSSSKATVTPGAQPSASSTPAVDVMSASSPALGTILVDAKGMTLYTLTNGGKAVACTGQCATFWPPLVLPSGSTSAVGATGVTGLAAATGTAGMQVTDNGLPLYRFSKDAAPGDTNGEGLSSFGGTWHVVKTTAAPSAPAVTNPPATDTPTTAAGYGGY